VARPARASLTQRGLKGLVVLLSIAAFGGAPALLRAQADPPDQSRRPRELRQVDTASLLARGLSLVDRWGAADHEEARRLLRQALKKNPDLAEAHAGLARSDLYLYGAGIDERQERIDAALSESERAVALAPEDPAIRAVRALALAAADRTTPALAEAELSDALGSGRMDGPLALCIVQRLRRSLDASLAACRRAADLAPDAPRVLMALAETLRESGVYDGAMNLYGQAADLEHDSPLPQLGGAATLARSGATTIAARSYQAILDHHPDVKLRALEGAAGNRVAAGDYETALDLYQQAELPENGSLWTLLSLYGKGYALLKLDRGAEAEYFLSLVTSRVPSDYDGPARGREVLFLAYDGLVDWYAGRQRPERVEALLREAATRPLAPTRMARRLGTILHGRGKDAEAAGLLEQAILRADPLEDRLELADSAVALELLRSSEGKKAIPDGSPAGRALDAVAGRLDAKTPAAACYRMARAYSLARDADSSLSFLGRSRDGGYLPADQAATDPAFAFLRQRPEFQRFLGGDAGTAVRD
jgi:tetratricopeptide (TPR) repeat protein